ncbi:MAG: MoaD/ThiS family protein [Planctomycetaceae bacterium]|nr:MoaD/ThiS family protein [Planctomycetaceae bacterium]
MKIILEYTAQLRRAAGCVREALELNDGATLSELLQAAGERHGDEFRRQLLTDSGDLRPSLLLFRGDEQVPAGSSPHLADGETVTVMSPISGG